MLLGLEEAFCSGWLDSSAGPTLAIDMYDHSDWVFGLFCVASCRCYGWKVYVVTEEPFPLCVLQSQMSFLPPGYPWKYERSTGDEDSVLHSRNIHTTWGAVCTGSDDLIA